MAKTPVYTEILNRSVEILFKDALRLSVKNPSLALYLVQAALSHFPAMRKRWAAAWQPGAASCT